MNVRKAAAAAMALTLGFSWGGSGCGLLVARPADAATPYVQWCAHRDGIGSDGRWYDHQGNVSYSFGSRGASHRHRVAVQVLSGMAGRMVTVATTTPACRSHS